MIEKIDYVQKNGGAVIVRCYGAGAVVHLPDRIRGLWVTELADHCFAKDASALYGAEEIRSAGCREMEWLGEEKENGAEGAPKSAGVFACTENGGGTVQTRPGEQYPVINTINIEEIILPEHLSAIGNYAFYGCLKLRSLHIPWRFRRLGGGVFVACNHIRQLYFTMEKPGAIPDSFKDFIGELPYELEVELEGENEKIRLIYPEYYEESRENTPARIIEIVYHGTGYKYRQCFAGRQIEYHQYDHLFPLAVAQEAPETVLKLVLCRLETPEGLLEDARERYLDWLRQEYKRTAAYVMEREDSRNAAAFLLRGGSRSPAEVELLRMLADQGYYTEEILEYFLDAASEHKKAEAVSFLMDYRQKKFPRKKKTFEFNF